MISQPLIHDEGRRRHGKPSRAVASMLWVATAIVPAMATLSACGSSAPEPEETSEQLPALSSTITTEDAGDGATSGPTPSSIGSQTATNSSPPPALSEGASLSGQLETTEGYIFFFEYSDLVTTVSTNVVDQKPGKALVTISMEGVATVTNQTPGRNVTTSPASVLAVYAGSSPLCKGRLPGPQSPPIATVFTGGDEEYCALESDDPEPDFTLAEGESGTTTVSGYMEVVVPETDLAIAEEDAAKPDFWAFDYSRRFVEDYEEYCSTIGAALVGTTEDAPPSCQVP